MADEDKIPYARGHRRLAIIRDLARGVDSQSVIAERYGVTQAAVSKFSQRNEQAIASLKSLVSDEAAKAVAGAWIAEKADRIWEYQGYVEHLAEAAELVEPDRLPSIYRTSGTLLRSVAEELGHLAPKEVPVAGQLTVRLEGVDTEAI